MSRTMLEKDNITVDCYIDYAGFYSISSNEDWTIKEELQEEWRKPFINLKFTLLVNWKLKSWSTRYELTKTEIWDSLWLKDYNAWYDIRSFLCTLWYDLSEINIDNWIEQFEI